jgi:hypothetical protein
MLADRPAGWMQEGPKRLASRIPAHRGISAGGRHRRSPAGGRAKGRPLKMRSPLSSVPRAAPAGASTVTGACAAAGAVRHAASARIRRRTEQTVTSMLRFFAAASGTDRLGRR